ncbi:MAG: class I SAM-dependent methyltransferase [Actinomycetota bacterium]
MFNKSASIYDLIYVFKDYAVEAESLRKILQERRPEARSLLDVACGTGTHLEHLQHHYEVTGVDLDAGLLTVAKGRLPGVRLLQQDMTAFNLGEVFDVVTCLFSSIGYTLTTQKLSDAVACMSQHLAPDGLLLVEPWIFPNKWEDGHLGANFIDEPDVKIARFNISARDGSVSLLSFHYLVATRDGIEHFTETHELGLFTDDDYRAAFADAGLQVEFLSDAFTTRGLYVGSK